MLFYKNSQWLLKTAQDLSCMGDGAIQVVCAPENSKDALFWSLFCVAWRSTRIPGVVSNPISSPVKKVPLTQRSACCYGIEPGGLESTWERLLDATVLLWECWLCLSFSPQLSAVRLSAHEVSLNPHVLFVLPLLTVLCPKQGKKLPRDITKLKGEKIRSVCC